jgi:hypothetical protein
VTRVAGAAGSVPVFINTRDRVTPLLQQIDWLERAAVDRIVIVDNASTYEPLLDYLRSTPHEVVRLEENLGHIAPWLSGAIAERVGPHDRYVETDPDVLPDEGCPLDALERFSELLDRHADTCKVGFGLRIDDLPRHYRHAEAVRQWEAGFWTDEVEPGVYRALIDTTFALYREGTPLAMEPALRTGRPYVARHLPWYADSSEPSAEQQYYLRHAKPDINSWDGDLIASRIADYIEVDARRRRRSLDWVRRRLRRQPG